MPQDILASFFKKLLLKNHGFEISKEVKNANVEASLLANKKGSINK